MNKSAIEISDLHFAYTNQPTTIHIPHWLVEQGKQTFLYGPSGSGKSTLLNLLCGILSPQQGTISLLGKSFSQLKAKTRDQFRANHIGVVFQEFNLIPFLSVRENIQVATYFAKAPQARTLAPKQCDTIFERLKLDTKLLNKRPDTLSVGQRQRVSIARALINQPEILIADEPTSALDSDNRDEFMQLLLDTTAISQCTVLFVSHDQALRQHFTDTIAINELLTSA